MIIDALNFWLSEPRPEPTRKCPSCESPDPDLHPAMQIGGEVQPCLDAWHHPRTAPVVTTSLFDPRAQAEAVMSTKFAPIKAIDQYDRANDYDTDYDQGDHKAVEALLLGHAVSKVADDHLLLDDGTLLKLVGNDGGCSCTAGCYDLTALNGVENIITSVEFEDEPGGDEYPDDGGSWGLDGAYRIFVYADNERINLATFEGTDGNGYYGTGYHVMVRLPKAVNFVHDDRSLPRFCDNPEEHGCGRTQS